MHRAQVYFETVIAPAVAGNPWTSICLNGGQAGVLQNELNQDAWGYLYSAAVSIGDAIHGIGRELFSWSTVKLYYAAFYAIRAQLAANSFAVVYHKQPNKATPYGVHVSAGAYPEKQKGTTHGLVLDLYEERFPTSPIITQAILSDKPLQWLIERREEANYKNGCFLEPVMPSFFSGVTQKSMRLTLDAYINDAAHTYCFDPDHAILALPILLFKMALRDVRSVTPGQDFAPNQSDFLQDIYKDQFGATAALKSLLK